MVRTCRRLAFARYGLAAALLAGGACPASEGESEGETAATPCGNGVLDEGEVCDDGNRVDGDGCTALCARGWRRAFISSTVHKGDLGGAAGADAICQGLADAAGLDGTFIAWISDRDTTPAERFTRSTIPYVLVTSTADDPQIIATNWDDLTDGALSRRINYDETGALAFVPTDAWTNTSPDGARNFDFVDCQAWTADGGTSGAVGDGDSLAETWTKNTTTSCSMELRIYCFEEFPEG